MISKQKFINQSLEFDLFFLRIMKEHSIFLEAAFTLRDKNLIAEADALKNEFTALLSHAISLANGVIPSEVLEADEIVTKYTMDAERATQFTTGIFIDSRITSMEKSLMPDVNNKNISMLAENVHMLNHRALAATDMIIRLKTNLKNNVLSCKTFTSAYPLLIDHILREAVLFRGLLTKLQNGLDVDMDKDILEQEAFWNRLMSEHCFFIRGMLDPSEVELFGIANNFGKEFEALRQQSSSTNKSSLELSALTDNTLKAATRLRDFKAQGTEGLLGCKIRSVIFPLLADHVLREANHYINLLKSFKD